MQTTLSQSLPGLFISFEGCDGSGKSTQIVKLTKRLKSIGLNPLVTREPGGTDFGEIIRQLLLDPASPDRTILSELLLYAAARSEFVSKIVKPALEQGHIVITERYTDSTWVYQGYAGGVSFSDIENINAIATDGLTTDLTLLLDIKDSSVVTKRLASKQRDKIESRSEKYHNMVREGYRTLATRFPHRIKRIDASLDMHAVESLVWKEIVRILAGKEYRSIGKNKRGEGL